MTRLDLIKRDLARLIGNAQDHALTLSGQEHFDFGCWLTDLMGLRDELLSGNPGRLPIPVEPQAREERLDTDPRVTRIAAE